MKNLKYNRLLVMSDTLKAGTFVPPTAIEIDHVEQIGSEKFGPICHVRKILSESRS